MAKLTPDLDFMTEAGQQEAQEAVVTADLDFMTEQTSVDSPETIDPSLDFMSEDATVLEPVAAAPAARPQTLEQRLRLREFNERKYLADLERMTAPETIRTTSAMNVAREGYERQLAARPEALRLPLARPWEVPGMALSATVEAPFAFFDVGGAFLNPRYTTYVANGATPDEAREYTEQDKAAWRASARAKPGEVLRSIQNFIPEMLKGAAELAMRDPYKAADQVTLDAAKRNGVEDLLPHRSLAASWTQARIDDAVRQNQEAGVYRQEGMGDTYRRPTSFGDVDSWVVTDENGTQHIDTRVLQQAYPGLDLTSPEGFKKLAGMAATWGERQKTIRETGADDSTLELIWRALSDHAVENWWRDPGKYLMFGGIEPVVDALGFGDAILGVTRVGARALKGAASVGRAAAEVAGKTEKAAKYGSFADRMQKVIESSTDFAMHIDPVKVVSDALWEMNQRAMKKAMARGDHATARKYMDRVDNVTTQIEDSLKRMDADGITIVRQDAAELLQGKSYEWRERTIRPIYQAISTAVADALGLKKPTAPVLGKIGLSKKVREYDATVIRATDALLTEVGKRLEGQTGITGRGGYGIEDTDLTSWLDDVDAGDDFALAFRRTMEGRNQGAFEKVYDSFREAAQPSVLKELDERMAEAATLRSLLEAQEAKPLLDWAAQPASWERLGYSPYDAGRSATSAAKTQARVDKLLTQARALETAGEAEKASKVAAKANVAQGRLLAKLRKVDESLEDWRSPENLGAAIDRAYRKQFAKTKLEPAADLQQPAAVDEAATSLVESVEGLPGESMAVRPSDRMARLEKVTQRVVRGDLGLRGEGAGLKVADEVRLYNALRMRQLENAAQGIDGPIVPSDVVADAMLLAPESPLGQAGIEALKTGFAQKPAGPSALRLQPETLDAATEAGLKAAAEVAGKDFVLDLVTKARLNGAILDLIEKPRQYITQQFDELIREGWADPAWVANLDKYLPELGLSYHDNTSAITSKWHHLQRLFGSNIDRARKNKGVASATGMVTNLVTRFHQAAMDMTQAAVTQKLARDAAFFGEMKGLTRTGKMIDQVTGADNVRRNVFRAVVDFEEDGTPITRDIVELTENDLAGKAYDAKKKGMPRLAAAQEAVQSKGSNVFFDAETLDYLTYIPNDKRKFGAMAGTLQEKRLADYLRAGDPLLIKEQAQRLAQGWLGKQVERMGGRFKTAHVAASPTAALRNILNNTLYSTVVPWGRSYWNPERMASIRKQYIEFAEGKAQEGNLFLDAFKAGQFDNSWLGAEGIQTKRTLGMVWNEMDRIGRVYDEAATGSKSKVMNVLGAPVRANDLFLKEASSLYNFVEVASKILNKAAFEDEIRLFSKAEHNVLQAVGGRVQPQLVRDVMVRGIESPYYSDVLTAYAQGTGKSAREAKVALGMDVKASKLVDSYRWFERPGWDEVAKSVDKALANPNRAAWDAADLIMFNYHKINGLTRALRGTAGSAFFSPFITWSSKAAKLGAKLAGSHPVETAAIMHLSDAADRVWEMSLAPDEREVYAQMTAAMNAAQADNTVLTGMRTLQDVEGAPLGVTSRSIRGFNMMDIAGFDPMRAGEFMFEGGGALWPNALRSGWATRPFAMGVLGTDPITKRPAELEDALAAIPEMMMSPLFVKPAFETYNYFSDKPTSASGLRRDPNPLRVVTDQFNIFKEQTTPLDVTRKRAYDNTKALFSAEQLKIKKRYEDIMFSARNKGLTPRQEQALERLEEAWRKLDEFAPRIDSLLNPGVQ